MYKIIQFFLLLVLIISLTESLGKPKKSKGKVKKAPTKTIKRAKATIKTTKAKASKATKASTSSKAKKILKQETKKVIDYCVTECPVQNLKIVCGSDDKEYQSQCHLKRESCLKNNSITVQHRGKCDCPDSCSKGYKPVCGSNEKTYHNICQLKKDACRSKGNTITFVKKGPCKPWKSKCPAACADIWAPVCGTDGKTYSSICSMKLVGCKSTQKIGVKTIGYCSHKCPESCPENHRPLCANDMKMYENDCEMRLEACKLKKLSELKRSSKKKLCPNKCVQKCPSHDNKVCGSNYVTYKNECELHRQNCNRKGKVRILKKGPCDPLKEMEVLPKIVVGVGSKHVPTIL